MNLVTGGGGFIGGHIVRLLLEEGARVRVLDLEPPLDLPAAVETVRGTVTDREVVDRVMAGVQRVFHVAGNPRLWDRDKRVFEEVHRRGTRTVLAAAAAAGVARIVHTSSATVLLAVPPGVATDVPAPPEASHARLPGAYVRSKLAAEQEVREAVGRGVPVVTVRPTLPVGPGDRHRTPPTRMLVDFLAGRNPAFLESELNLIDVRDVARGHILAAERGTSGRAYLLGNQTFRLSELLALLERLTGARMPDRRVPYALALAAAGVSELVADFVSGRPPTAPLAGVRLAHRLRLHDPCAGAVALGLPLTPIETALSDAIAWLIAEGHVDAAWLPERGPAGARRAERA